MQARTSEAGRVAGGAGRAQDITSHRRWHHGLFVVTCSSLSVLAHAQTPTATRDDRLPLDRSTVMTELETLNVPAGARVLPTAAEDTSIRPFRIKVPEKALIDLRRRLAATRWPDKETVADRSQGPRL